MKEKEKEKKAVLEKRRQRYLDAFFKKLTMFLIDGDRSIKRLEANLEHFVKICQYVFI